MSEIDEMRLAALSCRDWKDCPCTPCCARREIVRLRRFEIMYQEATKVLGDEEVLQYVTSGNTIPVTRCTVSADLIRQLVEARRPVLQEPADHG
jgi:hypothetical protein